MFPLSNAPSCQPVRFEVLADAEPGLLSRTLAPFARRDLIPDKVHAWRDGGSMLIGIGMKAMPKEMLTLIEGNLQQIVGVQRVTLVLYPAQQAG